MTETKKAVNKLKDKIAELEASADANGIDLSTYLAAQAMAGLVVALGAVSMKEFGEAY